MKSTLEPKRIGLCNVAWCLPMESQSVIMSHIRIKKVPHLPWNHFCPKNYSYTDMGSRIQTLIVLWKSGFGCPCRYFFLNKQLKCDKKTVNKFFFQRTKKSQKHSFFWIFIKHFFTFREKTNRIKNIRIFLK